MKFPQFSKLTKSKTKQFCETSFKNGKLTAKLTASYHCVLRFFHSTCLKYCACHKKVMPSHTKCCTCQAKSSLMLQNATLSGNQRPDLLTCFLHCFLLTLLKLLQNHHFLLTFDKVHNPLRLPRKTPSERPKVLRTR